MKSIINKELVKNKWIVSINSDGVNIDTYKFNKEPTEKDMNKFIIRLDKNVVTKETEIENINNQINELQQRKEILERISKV